MVEYAILLAGVVLLVIFAVPGLQKAIDKRSSESKGAVSQMAPCGANLTAEECS